MKTFYQILDVGELATNAEIKTAFREKSKLLHPDHGGNTEDFQLLNEAYHALSDPVKRANYDWQLHQQSANQSDQSDYYQEEPDVEVRPSNLVLFLQFLFVLSKYTLIYYGLMKLGEWLHLETLAYCLYIIIFYCAFFKSLRTN
jgi:curved DNA-binding protein CbpA